MWRPKRRARSASHTPGRSCRRSGRGRHSPDPARSAGKAGGLRRRSRRLRRWSVAQPTAHVTYAADAYANDAAADDDFAPAAAAKRLLA